MNKAKKILLLAVLTPVTAFSQPPQVPIAPRAGGEYMGWTNAFRLANGLVDAVIVPEAGRMIHFGPAGGENLLRLDKSLAGQSYPRKNGKDWKNFGGQWMWPAAQSAWPSFQTNDWPPSSVIDRKPWTGFAWTEADGAAACVITRHFGEPLHVEARQLYRLMPSNDFITIRQSLVRTEKSSVPVTIWNLVQVPLPERIAFETGLEQEGSPGWETLKFSPPDPEQIKTCGSSVVYEPGTSEEIKIGSRAPVARMAAFKGPQAVIMKAAANSGEPDGKIYTEIYVNSGLAYAELEVLGTETNLVEDEAISFTTQIQVLNIIPAAKDPCGQLAETKALSP